MLLFAALLTASLQADSLQIRFVGNEGVELSDGRTTLLTDLPYRPGAFGYMTYDPGALRPAGRVVSLISHGHADHFDPALFRPTGWEIIGPREVTRSLPGERVLPLADTIRVGAFTVHPVPTPHGPEHYSYLVTWRGRRLYLVGDTEQADALLAATGLDVAFVSPWLACTVSRSGAAIDAARVVIYHHRSGEGTRGCLTALVPAPGESFALAPKP